ncbi:MAG TPA: hypothetical protein DDZ51_11960 [Planctomycetaceae bacterium]|nr:hypothetical protein [Planctomycetaceae bacterium]
MVDIQHRFTTWGTAQMSGDIEDFLKRAAERRQARQASRPAAPQQSQRPAARPEYTDSRRERSVRPREDDDELVVAEVIEQPLAKRIADLKQKQAEVQAAKQSDRAGSAAKRDAVAVESDMSRNDRNRATRRAADRAEAALQSRRGSAPLSAPVAAQTAASQRNAIAAGQVDAGGELINELLQSLKSPNGLQRAVLLHEILERPVHRW